jgi:glycosyltransferase involved in cell wall biosynthesis
MKFLRKSYRPWTFLWVIQRFFAVVKEGRLPQIRMVDLMYDLRLTRKINTGLKRSGNHFEVRQDDPGDDIFNFIPSAEYHPCIVNENISRDKISLLNSVFDHIYVLNLGKRIDRRVEIIQKLKKYNIQAEIIEAVNGYTAENEKEFYDFYRQPLGGKGTHHLERTLKKKMISSPGAWGYLKTYKSIIGDARQNNYRKILCFDDDVLFHKSFEDELQKAFNQLPEDWKLLYLGATQHEWNVPYNVNYPENVREKDFEVSPYYFPVRTDGSFAVGIDSGVYGEILGEIELMNCALDSGPLRTVQQNHPGECFVLNPNLVVADVSQSDIGVERDQHQMARKLRWKMDLYEYPFRKELVSVIMPAFNAEKTIEKSIRSILLQSYMELEMIVADDGSADSTPEIVERLAREDSRVKLVRMEQNSGCYPARNAALKASSGTYIAIQDSDDISLSTRIETQLIPLMLGKAEFTLTRIFRSRCSVDELDINNQKEMMQLVLSRRIESASGLFEYRDRPVIGFMTSMFKRSLFEELGLFWEYRFGADAEFLERILYQKAGILLSKQDGTIHTYLMDRESIPGIYQRIDKVQLISIDMTGDNITNRHSKEEKESFETTWRKRLRGEITYDYPAFRYTLQE